MKVGFLKGKCNYSLKEIRKINLVQIKNISIVNSPTYNVLSNIQISSTINYVDWITNKYNTEIFGLNEFAIPLFLLGFSIRFLQIPTVKFIEIINYFYKTRMRKRKEKIFNVNLDDHNKNPFFNKLFNNDLNIEASNLKLNKIEIEFIKKGNKIETIFSYIVQIILLMNNIKVINYFAIKYSFINECSIGMINNETFLILFLFNFLSLKYTNHSWLLYPQLNSFKLLNLSFFSSLPFLIFCPFTAYNWIGYCFAHIIISYGNKKIVNYLVYKKSIKQYFENNPLKY